MSSLTAKDRVSLCSFTFPALFCTSTHSYFRDAPYVLAGFGQHSLESTLTEVFILNDLNSL